MSYFSLLDLLLCRLSILQDGDFARHPYPCPVEQHAAGLLLWARWVGDID